jgi:hypothetical protein
MKHLTVAVLCLSLMGCATLFKGTNSDIAMSSDPTGASVYVDGQYVGDTPAKISLKSKGEYLIEFRKDGFKTKSIRVTNHIGAGWIILDVVAGLVPVIIDAVTGAWYSFDQKNINAVLEKYLVPLPSTL